MPYRIHINSNTLRSNKKHGTSKPPITIRKGNKVIGYVNALKILGESTVMYQPDNPLPCGAKVWIETEAPIEITESGETLNDYTK